MGVCPQITQQRKISGGRWFTVRKGGLATRRRLTTQCHSFSVTANRSMGRRSTRLGTNFGAEIRRSGGEFIDESADAVFKMVAIRLAFGGTGQFLLR